jgi:fumarate reductase (CoM/CoB) subunit B
MPDTDRCMKCNSCVRACPVTSEVGELVFPGPRTVAVDAPRFGPTSRAIVDVAWICSMCDRCAQACPSRIELPKAMLNVRGALYGERPLRPGHERLVRNIDHYGLSVEPSQGLGMVTRSRGAKVAYFPGCIASQRETGILQGALDLIEATGAEVDVPAGLMCCGSPLAKLGDEVRRRRCMEENLKVLERYDQVVTSCPGCTVQLTEGYGLEAMHITEFLTEASSLERLEFKSSTTPTKTALHLACHLSRGVGPHTTEGTYRLIGMVPGIELVETDDMAVCCGAGGSLLSGYPDIAYRMAERKVGTALSAGAQLMTTACPFCVMNLRRPGNIELMELGQLIASRLRFPGQH